jgi:transcriptional regulator with XRE-family HTH domain
MYTHAYGSLVKKLRKQKGITQQMLAGDYMARSHLSKIENGKVMPGKNTMETLLEKLGFDAHQYLSYYLDPKMSEYQNQMDSLDSFLAYKDVEKATILITELSSDSKFMQHDRHRQYILCAKAANEMNNGNYDYKVVHSMLYEALTITIHNFREDCIDGYLLSKHELKAINMLAMTYAKNDRLDDAINILTSLRKNFDKPFIDKTYKGKHYPLFIINLTSCLHQAERYKEAVEVCEEAKKVCLDTGFLYCLPSIILNMAMSQHKLGDNMSCERNLKQAYYSSDMYEMFDNVKYIKEFAEHKLGIKF